MDIINLLTEYWGLCIHVLALYKVNLSNTPFKQSLKHMPAWALLSTEAYVVSNNILFSQDPQGGTVLSNMLSFSEISGSLPPFQVLFLLILVVFDAS